MNGLFPQPTEVHLVVDFVLVPANVGFAIIFVTILGPTKVQLADIVILLGPSKICFAFVVLRPTKICIYFGILGSTKA